MVVMEQLISEPVVFGEADIRGVWPTVKNVDWCGEWEAKGPEVET